MDHFPFFLVAFPRTAKTLSSELQALLKDVERSALWSIAKTWCLHQNNLAHREGRGWSIQVERQIGATLQAFMRTIPARSGLWHCFGLEEYLREGLWSAVAQDALGEPPPPYGAKLLRCAPDNPIILSSQLDPIHSRSPRTTTDHRKQVERYVSWLEGRGFRGRASGPAYYENYAEFLDDMIRLIKLVRSKGQNPTQPRVAGYSRFASTHADGSLESAARLLRDYRKDAGYSWEQIKKMAAEAS